MKVKSLFLLAMFAGSIICFTGCPGESKTGTHVRQKATDADMPAVDPSNRVVEAPPA